MLRKTSETPNEKGNSEERLQRHLLSMQKWMVYWIVFGTVHVAESLLFLGYIVPMYSFIKLLFSMWLVSPMVIVTDGNNDGKSGVAANSKNIALFLENGCGLCYFRFVKPWLDGEFKHLVNLDISKLVPPSVLNYLNEYALIQKVSSYLKSRGGEDVLDNGLFNLVKSKVLDTSGSYLFVNNFFSSNELETKAAEPTTEAKSDSMLLNSLEEYDLVDKPTVKDGLSERKKDVRKDETKRGWIW